MKLTTFLAILLAMVSAFAFVTWQRLSVNLEEELSDSAEDINSKVPIVRDQHTDVIGAYAEGSEITYQFRVHGLSAEVMSSNGDLLRDGKIQLARGDANLRRLLDSGATLSYEYFVGEEMALRFSIEKDSISG